MSEPIFGAAVDNDPDALVESPEDRLAFYQAALDDGDLSDEEGAEVAGYVAALKEQLGVVDEPKPKSRAKKADA